MKLVIIAFLFLICQYSLGQEQRAFLSVEENALFQGHDINYFYKNFVLQSLQYPDSAKQNCIQGKVVAQFVVDTSGNISYTAIIRSLPGGCDNEVIRIIKLSSGMWTAGKFSHRKVNQQFMIHVNFALPKGACK